MVTVDLIGWPIVYYFISLEMSTLLLTLHFSSKHRGQIQTAAAFKLPQGELLTFQYLFYSTVMMCVCERACECVRECVHAHVCVFLVFSQGC